MSMENSVVGIKPFPQPVKIDTSNLKIKVVILKVKNEKLNRFCSPWDINILGKSMLDWVKRAVLNYKIKEVEYSEKDDPVNVLKNYIEDEDILIALYSDTPLISNISIMRALETIVAKNVNVCKLPRGYVFKSEFLKTVEKLYSAEPNYFNAEDFLTVRNLIDVAIITEVLQKRIINFHLMNGVKILKPSEVYIEADVSLKPTATIYANNVLCGNTVIEAGTTLYPNNTILSSKIGSNCNIYSSVIKNSSILDDENIKPFSNIENKQNFTAKKAKKEGKI